MTFQSLIKKIPDQIDIKFFWYAFVWRNWFHIKLNSKFHIKLTSKFHIKNIKMYIEKYIKKTKFQILLGGLSGMGVLRL
jgi:hypothetical protein